MSEDKPEMPPQPTTKQLPAVPDWAISMTEKVNRLIEGNSRVEDKVDTMGANLELVTGDVKGLKSDVRALQTWKNQEDERREKHSGGIRELSSENRDQDAAIGSLVTKVDSLGTKVDALAESQAAFLTDVRAAAKKLAANPIVVGLLTAAATAATTWLAARGHG